MKNNNRNNYLNPVNWFIFLDISKPVAMLFLYKLNQDSLQRIILLKNKK